MRTPAATGGLSTPYRFHRPAIPATNRTTATSIRPERSGLRGAAQPVERAERNLLSRREQCEETTVHVFSALKYRELENDGAAAVAADAELRRLTHSQYDHTALDLLGDPTAPAGQFPPEDFVNGFRNQSHGPESFASAD